VNPSNHTQDIRRVLRLASLCLWLPLAACAWLEPRSEAPVSHEARVEVFAADYEEVWRAMQKALVSYPLQTNNVDQGVLETDELKLGQVWSAPFPRDRKQLIGRYRLKLKLTKGKAGGRTSMRVAVLKQIRHEKDFFSGEDLRPSDGFEEEAILYRIRRELEIESRVKKAFEQKQVD
jgi:hypothetical protein